MVIITIGVNRRLHSVTNFFITQLALGDLCVLIFCMPFTVTAAYFFKVRLISTFIIITLGTRMYLLTHSTLSIILPNGGRRMFSIVLVKRNPYFLRMKIFFKLKPINLTYILMNVLPLYASELGIWSWYMLHGQNSRLLGSHDLSLHFVYRKL